MSPIVAMQRAEPRQQHNVRADEEFKQNEKDVLRDLIDRELLLQKAQELHLDPNPFLDEIKKRLPARQFEERGEIVRELGLPYAYFEQGARESVLMNLAVHSQVGANIEITQDEIKKFYEDHLSSFQRAEEVRLSAIIVDIAEGSQSPGLNGVNESAETLAAKLKAQRLLLSIRGGAHFEDVAREQLETGTIAYGGDLGYFKHGELDNALEKPAFSIKEGEISGVIPIKHGFAIIMVTDHQSPGVPPLSEVQEEISSIVATQKTYPALREYLALLREHAFIDLKSGYVDTGADPEQPGPGEIPQTLAILAIAVLIIVVAQVVVARKLKLGYSPNSGISA